MATLEFKGVTYTVDHAVKGSNYVHGYDANGVCVVAFEDVGDLTTIKYSGTYMTPESCAQEVCNKVIYCNNNLQTLGGETIKIVPGTYSLTLSANAWTLNDYGLYEQTVTLGTSRNYAPETHIGLLGHTRGLTHYPGDGNTTWGWSQSLVKSDKKKMACLYSAKLIAENTVKFTATKIPDGSLYVTIIFIRR